MYAINLYDDGAVVAYIDADGLPSGMPCGANIGPARYETMDDAADACSAMAAQGWDARPYECGPPMDPSPNGHPYGGHHRRVTASVDGARPPNCFAGGYPTALGTIWGAMVANLGVSAETAARLIDDIVFAERDRCVAIVAGHRECLGDDETAADCCDSLAAMIGRDTPYGGVAAAAVQRQWAVYPPDERDLSRVAYSDWNGRPDEGDEESYLVFSTAEKPTAVDGGFSRYFTRDQVARAVAKAGVTPPR